MLCYTEMLVKLTFCLFVGGDGNRLQTLAEMETYQEVIQGSIDDNKAKLAAARESAAAYHAELLANQERLDKLPKLDNVNEWIQRQQAVFTGGDYGANEQALATLLSAYATFVSNLPKMEEVRARCVVGVPAHSPTACHNIHTLTPAASPLVAAGGKPGQRAGRHYFPCGRGDRRAGRNAHHGRPVRRAAAPQQRASGEAAQN